MLINYNRLEKTVSPLHLVLPLTLSATCALSLSARLSLSTRLSLSAACLVARSAVSTANTSGSSSGHFILGAAIFIFVISGKNDRDPPGHTGYK